MLILGCKPDEPKLPFITSFTPLIGEAGTVVKITGGNLDAPTVYINNLKLTLTGPRTQNSVEAIIPAGVTSGTIRIETNNGAVESTDIFQVIGLPLITNFSPTTGITGTEIVINGQNFTETTTVKFYDNRDAQITSRTDSRLTVLVPDNSRPGKLIVITAGGSVTSAVDFIANPHTITSVLSAWTSLPVTVSGPLHRLLINGTNFNPVAAENIVKFNGKNVKLISQFNIKNQLEVIVPSGVTTGKISLTIGSHIVEYNQVIEVPAGEWKRLNEFTGSRLHAKVFVIGSEAFYGGSGYSGQKDFWKFSPANNSWSRIADIGGIKYNFVGFAAGGKGYVGDDNELWEYNPSNDQWIKKANPNIFFSRAAVGINGKGYMLNAYDTSFNEFYEYDPTLDKWTSKASFPLASLYKPGIFVLNNKMYVVSGMTKDSPVTFTKEMYEYNPVNNQWTKKADFPGNGRTSSNAFALNGFGYVGGGESNGTDYDDVWRYDSQQHKWFPSVPHPGYFTNSFVIGDKAYSGLQGGGTVGTNYFYEFTP